MSLEMDLIFSSKANLMIVYTRRKQVFFFERNTHNLQLLYIVLYNVPKSFITDFCYAFVIVLSLQISVKLLSFTNAKVISKEILTHDT